MLFIQSKVVHPLRQRIRNIITNGRIKKFVTKGPFNILRQFTNENWIIRILWILAYIISISSFSYYVYGIYVKWQHDPDISINIRTLPYHEIPFPAVTYCTPYVMSDEAANFTDYRMRIYLGEKLPEYSDAEQNLLSTMIELCSANLYPHAKTIKNRTESSIIKLINKTRKSFELLNENCGMSTFNYICDQMYNIVPTDKGLCYSFNMQGYNTIFNKDVLSDDFDFYRRKKIVKSFNTKSKLFNQTVDDDNETVHWTLQDGYLTRSVNSVPYRASRQVVSLYLGFRSLNFFKCFGNGFYVNLHLPNEVPIISQIKAFANLSSTTFIKFEVKSIKHNLNMKKYPPETRQCYFHGEKQLKFFKSYTTAHCNLECLSNYTLKKCGCAVFYMPRSPDTRVCELYDITCASDAYIKIYVYKAKIDRYNIPCNCLPPCNDIKYSIKDVISKPVPESNPLIMLMRKNNFSEPTIIEIGINSIEFEEQEHFVTYGLQNFIADAGGLLGLFMGYSFLSIAEFIQNCIKYFLENRTKRNQEVVVQVAPRNIV